MARTMMTFRSNRGLRGLEHLRDAAAFTWGSWRQMFDPGTVGRNLAAGLTIALVALPLNLALALACGLPPAVGLVTGAVAGAVGALFGGSRLQVTGPEVALAPMTMLIVLDEGVAGLLVATFLCGLFQIAFGVLQLGEVVRRVPRPVVGGFMTAIGLLVFDSQLPRLLGLPKDITSVRDALDTDVLQQVALEVPVVGGLVVATVLIAPRLLPRVPGPLLGLAAATLVALALPAVPTVEPFATGFPAPRLPDLAALHLSHLIPEALALAVLASIDSLLCAASVDARTGGPRTRNDHELVAQGLANIASACVGGMPVAAAVVRSMAAVEARASTRLAPLFQSVCLALALLMFGQAVTHVPLVALAAILLVVGYRLLDVQLIRRLWGLDRWEAAILLGTSLAILCTDFVSGVALGCALALARFASSMAGSLAIQRLEGPGGVEAVRLQGPLFFANQTLLDTLASQGQSPRRLLVDLSGLTAVDSSGAVALRITLESLASEARPIWVTTFPEGARWLRAEIVQSSSPHLRVAAAEDVAVELAAPGQGRDGSRGLATSALLPSALHTELTRASSVPSDAE
jgi:SulP family sulfate permease